MLVPLRTLTFILKVFIKHKTKFHGIPNHTVFRKKFLFATAVAHHAGLNKISKTRQKMHYNVILRGVRATIVKVEKQLVSHSLNVYLQPCVCSMQCVCAVACRALQYFSTLSQNRHDFRKESY